MSLFHHPFDCTTTLSGQQRQGTYGVVATQSGTGHLFVEWKRIAGSPALRAVSVDERDEESAVALSRWRGTAAAIANIKAGQVDHFRIGAA